MEQKTFIFNCEWAEALEGFEAEVQLEVYKAVIAYAATGKESALSPLARMAFNFIKRELDYNRQKYAEISEQRRMAGKKAVAARRAKAKQNGETIEEPQDDEDDSKVDNAQQNVTNDNNEQQTVTNPNKAQQNVTNDNKANYNEYDYDYKEKETLSKERVKKKKADVSFSAPSIDEVVRFFTDQGYACDAESFYDYYQANGWMVGRAKMKDWQAAARNWERRERELTPLKCINDGNKGHEDIRRRRGTEPSTENRQGFKGTF